MDLKTTIDLYEQGKADLLDIALALTELCGTGDPREIARAVAIINGLSVKKNTATTGNSDGNEVKDYEDLQTVFLQYCEVNQLNIKEAGDLLDRFKNDLQEQLCHVATRKKFNEMGDAVKYY